ncbi:hypothetical protein NKR23_g6759 [Pleurostoma richardsiae]|uniref:Uncharacterized protein n=1 Tax=Pleurostoma richardsiae TaxID=41990 RepID=A0AA38RBX3_9PEZI|nr:hypothetical protein NKR23_g6759 [Pleurostoma richardsiae]
MSSPTTPADQTPTMSDIKELWASIHANDSRMGCMTAKEALIGLGISDDIPAKAYLYGYFIGRDADALLNKILEGVIDYDDMVDDLFDQYPRLICWKLAPESWMKAAFITLLENFDDWGINDTLVEKEAS